jgi:copper(I)-binding protein
MKLRNLILNLLFLMLAPLGGALADDVGDFLSVSDAYARAVPPGSPTSAAFMTLHNAQAADRALVEVRSQAAQNVEMHTHTMDGGMMRMRRVERIDIKAGGTTELKPGGLHVMLIGLQQPMPAGGRIALELEFDDGTVLPVEAPVREVMRTMQHHHHSE